MLQICPSSSSKQSRFDRALIEHLKWLEWDLNDTRHILIRANVVDFCLINSSY